MTKLFDRTVKKVRYPYEIRSGSPLAEALEQARVALDGEVPTVIYVVEGGTVVQGDTNAVFIGEDGTLAVTEIEEAVNEVGLDGNTKGASMHAGSTRKRSARSNAGEVKPRLRKVHVPSVDEDDDEEEGEEYVGLPEGSLTISYNETGVQATDEDGEVIAEVGCDLDSAVACGRAILECMELIEDSYELDDELAEGDDPDTVYEDTDEIIDEEWDRIDDLRTALSIVVEDHYERSMDPILREFERAVNDGDFELAESVVEPLMEVYQRQSQGIRRGRVRALRTGVTKNIRAGNETRSSHKRLLKKRRIKRRLSPGLRAKERRRARRTKVFSKRIRPLSVTSSKSEGMDEANALPAQIMAAIRTAKKPISLRDLTISIADKGGYAGLDARVVDKSLGKLVLAGKVKRGKGEGTRGVYSLGEDAVEEVTRAEHEKIVARAMKSQGTSKRRAIDSKEHPKRKGLEGPFQFKAGRVLYYDPKEGKYYDAGSDIYVDPPRESVDEAAKHGFEVGDRIQHTAPSGRVSGGTITGFITVASGTYAKYKSAKGKGEIKVDAKGVTKVSEDDAVAFREEFDELCEDGRASARSKKLMGDVKGGKLKGQMQIRRMGYETIASVGRQSIAAGRSMADLRSILKAHGLDPKSFKQFRSNVAVIEANDDDTDDTSPATERKVKAMAKSHGAKKVTGKGPSINATFDDRGSATSFVKAVGKLGVKPAMRRSGDTEFTVHVDECEDVLDEATVPKIEDPVYTRKEKPRGYNVAVTPLFAHGTDGAKMLRARLPKWSKADHAAAARSHERKAAQLDKAWSEAANAAAQETWGRDYRATDYRVSGVASSEFGSKHKEKLRHAAQTATKHRDAANAHSLVASLRNVGESRTTMRVIDSYMEENDDGSEYPVLDLELVTEGVPEKHQRKIARDTLKMSKSGALVMGGMDHAGAVAVLRDAGWSPAKIASQLKAAGHGTSDIKKWMKESFDEDDLEETVYPFLEEGADVAKLKQVYALAKKAAGLRSTGKIPQATTLETKVTALVKKCRAAGYGDEAEAVEQGAQQGDSWKEAYEYAMESEDDGDYDPLLEAEDLRRIVTQALAAVKAKKVNPKGGGALTTMLMRASAGKKGKLADSAVALAQAFNKGDTVPSLAIIAAKQALGEALCDEALITVRVTTTGGDSWVTDINGPFAKAKAYFMGNSFNIGTGGRDKMVKVKKVELVEGLVEEDEKGGLASEMATYLINRPRADAESIRRHFRLSASAAAKVMAAAKKYLKVGAAAEDGYDTFIAELAIATLANTAFESVEDDDDLDEQRIGISTHDNVTEIGFAGGTFYYKSKNGAKHSVAIPPAKRKGKDKGRKFAEVRFRQMLRNEAQVPNAGALIDKLVGSLPESDDPTDTVSVVEATNKGDRAVIVAFTEKKALDGKKLTTDGTTLDGNWTGGNGIAEWSGGKIHFNDLGSKAAQSIQRAVKKEAPRNWIAEDEDEEVDLVENYQKVKLLMYDASALVQAGDMQAADLKIRDAVKLGLTGNDMDHLLGKAAIKKLRTWARKKKAASKKNEAVAV